MSRKELVRSAAVTHGPTPEDWIEVLTNPTIDPVVGSRFVGGGRNAGYQACETGDLPALKYGGRWRVLTEPLLQRVGIVTAEARDAALRRAREDLTRNQGRRSATDTAQAAA